MRARALDGGRVAPAGQGLQQHVDGPCNVHAHVALHRVQHRVPAADLLDGVRGQVSPRFLLLRPLDDMRVDRAIAALGKEEDRVAEGCALVPLIYVEVRLEDLQRGAVSPALRLTVAVLVQVDAIGDLSGRLGSDLGNFL